MIDFRDHYIRINKGKIQIRTSGYEDWRAMEWPWIGFEQDGKEGMKPELAREFAKAIMDAADEIEKKNLPEFWPPRPGDVWRRHDNVDYFVGARTVFTSSASKDGEFFKYTLESVVRAVEEIGEDYKLVYRKGVKEAETS